MRSYGLSVKYKRSVQSHILQRLWNIMNTAFAERYSVLQPVITDLSQEKRRYG